MDDLWPRIIALWQQSGIAIRPGVDVAELIAFEDRYEVRLTNDVREYFSAVDGTGDDMDEEYMYRFWPLAEVRPVRDVLVDHGGVHYPDRYMYPDCFVFADHCISCWDYAVKLTSDPNQPGPVFRVTASETPGEQMAGSFREFMLRYANDPSSII